MLSLLTSLATRIPGIVGVLWFLPLVRFGLGTQEYATLLAAMALGTAAAFLIGGYNVMGRRLVGEAYAAGRPDAEADGFASLFVANLAGWSIATGVIGAYVMTDGKNSYYFLIAMMPATGITLTMFDNARVAYNEHYVTALVQLALQVVIYTGGFLLPAARNDILLAALVINSPTILASLVTLTLLLRTRPYLPRGRPNALRLTLREGTVVAIAEGSVTTALSVAVVWLEAASPPETSAWFSTVVRLSQSLLFPAILVLGPISSYIRLYWHQKSRADQNLYAKASLVIGAGYGATLALGLYVASRFYVSGLLHLPAPPGWLNTVPIFCFFAAIVAWKAYSSIAYLVLNSSAHLSNRTTGAIGISGLLSAAAALVADPLTCVNVFAATGALLIFAVLITNLSRSLR